MKPNFIPRLVMGMQSGSTRGIATAGSAEKRQPLFQVRGLTKTYYPGGDVEIRALNGVDLDLFERELVVLLGASGSGKSTLLNILGGLDVPTAGTLAYRDGDLTDADDRALTRFRREAGGGHLPVLQPDSQLDGARKRRPHHRHRQRSDGALFRRGGEWMTFVVGEGKAKLRTVRIGHTNGVTAEVVEGLSAGETVVVYPPDDLADGAAVTIARPGTE